MNNRIAYQILWYASKGDSLYIYTQLLVMPDAILLHTALLNRDGISNQTLQVPAKKLFRGSLGIAHHAPHTNRKGPMLLLKYL